MINGLFITGTDTGIGKTFATCSLILTLGRMGIRAGAMKPIETGCAETPADGEFLRRNARMPEPMELITPVRYAAPLSPLAASELEGRPVDIAAIMAAYAKLAPAYDMMLVEGAGGLMVPIKENYHMRELARELDLGLIIVASPWLGTINHTLLTIEAARAAGLEVRGLIVSYTRPPSGGIDERTNPWMLGRLTKIPLLGVLPYGASPQDECLDRGLLADIIGL